jgi:hypothetical protein
VLPSVVSRKFVYMISTSFQPTPAKAGEIGNPGSTKKNLDPALRLSSEHAGAGMMERAMDSVLMNFRD